jgi:hypothetical protein
MDQAKYMQIILISTVIDLLIMGVIYFEPFPLGLENNIKLMICGFLLVNMVIVPLILKLNLKK